MNVVPTDAMGAWLQARARTRTTRARVRATVVPAQGVLDLAGNDYLGLAQDPVVVAAAQQATAVWGAGARASRVVTGTFEVHQELEQGLAQLMGYEAAVVFSSGYMANLGAVASLGGPGCTVVLDAHAHASLHDAARLSGAKVATMRHNDVAHAGQLLAGRSTPRAMVVTESVFSVLGDAAPLTELYELVVAHDSWLVVDEAHGVGVRGNGRGLLAELGLAGKERVVSTATCSKALAAQGGAVLGPITVRDHVVNEARAFVYDTGLAPAAAAAACAATGVVADAPELAAAVRRNAQLLAVGCGIPMAAGAVQSIPMPTPQQAVEAVRLCAAQEVLVGCFRPPSVPDGVSRLRLTASAALTGEQVAYAVQVVAKARQAVGA